MITLETERLLIRNFVGSDCEALYEMIVQYASSEFAAYDGKWPSSLEEFKGIVEWFAREDSFLAVCLKANGGFIGFVANNAEGENVYNLGYISNSDYHGKGYATEACRAALERVFRVLHADKIVTGTAADNRASWQLLERLGFRRTAENTGSLQNRPDGTPIKFRGYSYEVTREEWELAAGSSETS